jgi:glycosyltransferase involved in cell wall biosynthesis
MKMISVVVPVYNAEKYLSECIESILNQKYKDIELILVDDGSPDSSGAICDEYAKKDSRVRVIHKINEGVSKARNTGAQHANGELLMYVDSDDTIDEDMLFNMHKTMVDENVDCVVSGLRYCYEDDGSTEEHPLPKGIVREWKEINQYFADVTNALGFFSSCTKLYKMSIIRENNIKSAEHIRILEDVSFVYDYLKYANGCAFDEKCYYNYRHTKGVSLMKVYNDNALEATKYYMSATKWLVDILEQQNKDLFYDKTYSQMLAFINQIYKRSNMTSKEKKTKLKEFLNNEEFISIVKNTNKKSFSFKKKLMHFMLKHKMSFALNLLLK